MIIGKSGERGCAVAAGYTYGMALKSDGTVAAWGAAQEQIYPRE